MITVCSTPPETFRSTDNSWQFVGNKNGRVRQQSVTHDKTGPEIQFRTQKKE